MQGREAGDGGVWHGAGAEIHLSGKGPGRKESFDASRRLKFILEQGRNAFDAPVLLQGQERDDVGGRGFEIGEESLGAPAAEGGEQHRNTAEAGAAAGATREEKEGGAAGRIARLRGETGGPRIGNAQEAEERFHKFVTWGAKLGGVTKRFNPGGGGRSEGNRRVMIGRWMRSRGRHSEPHTGTRATSSESQVF